MGSEMCIRDRALLLVPSQSLASIFPFRRLLLTGAVDEASMSDRLMISFKGKHYPKDVILFAVFFYIRYAVSYHDLEEIMEERGVDVDHATLNRWVIEYGPLVAEEAQKRKQQTASSWRMDETYMKVKDSMGQAARPWHSRRWQTTDGVTPCPSLMD